MDMRNETIFDTRSLGRVLAGLRACVAAPQAEARGHELLVRLAELKPLALTVGTAQVLALRVADWVLPALGMAERTERQADGGEGCAGVKPKWSDEAKSCLRKHLSEVAPPAEAEADQESLLAAAIDRYVQDRGRHEVQAEDVLRVLRRLKPGGKWLD